jgi:deoxyribodipyrimidine photo-lyase
MIGPITLAPNSSAAIPRQGCSVGLSSCTARRGGNRRCGHFPPELGNVRLGGRGETGLRSTGMGRSDVQLVWFKRDLRVRDHLPLAKAAGRGAPVIALYVVEPSLWLSPEADGAQWEFIRESIVELRQRLNEMGGSLTVRVGEVVDVLDGLHRDHDIAVIHCHEETGNELTYRRDRAVHAWARSQRIEIAETPSGAVVRRLATRDDWGRTWEQRMHRPLSPTPTHFVAWDRPEEGPIPSVDDLGLERSSRIGEQRGGEHQAHAILEAFLTARVTGYEHRLSSPLSAWDGCSRLSPHLAYGTISLKYVVQQTRAAMGRTGRGARFDSIKAFEERLHWHCHFMQKLESEPGIEFTAFVPAFDALRVSADPVRLDAWKAGMTGYPMVDACMRALTATGWMNFRMRAMLVAFGAYDLWLPWRDIGLHLAPLFTDFEPGIHWSQVQMQSGTTAINALRIYDPTKQAIDHDPTGDFIRQWVPELRDVDDAHRPWLAAIAPKHYPAPIVDHWAAANAAEEQIRALRADPEVRDSSLDVLAQHGSRRPPSARSWRTPQSPPGRGGSRPSPRR